MAYFENQPDVFDLGRLGEPVRRGRIGNQIAVGMDEQPEFGGFEPKSDEKPSSLKCAGRPEELARKDANRRDQA